ncbi:23S rRNA (adenine(2030)-N(6))-methyltransferase RlmJ [Alteromonas gracilis]|uniref:23S rRNA (adenine(2030)-N(6))-methyltransferase RlmJ n=1 Tax=Alteromonas gracilis TaxID=1479524 RepID=UPI003219ADD8
MLSYQHAFHAGNHADVIKHVCWIGVINALKKKDKPFTLFDSHAGAYCYDLNDAMSSKNKEYESGITRVNNTDASSSLLSDYLNLCSTFLAQERYPGSPVISAMTKRNNDSLHVMELHPAEFDKLNHNLNSLRVDACHVHKRDGFEGLRALTPPKPNRGAILIDPPYERASEYKDVVNGVTQVLKRWQQAQIVIWYPLLSARAGAKHGASEAMCDALAALDVPCFKAQVCVTPNTEDAGMYGSGVMVLNPPWQLDVQLDSALQEAVSHMGAHASSSLVWLRRDA